MAVHCIVDDTALTTNMAELEAWVSSGAVSLVIPLYTIERLHLLKKDPSQIGQNARKAVKFLDRMTSGSDETVTLQGPDEQYSTWAEVEAHYGGEDGVPIKERAAKEAPAEKPLSPQPPQAQHNGDKAAKRASGSSTNVLSQMLLDKLNFAAQPAAASPVSTPPVSPSVSEPQSSKASPLVRVAVIAAAPVDKSPVPAALKPLLNPVAWYIHEKRADKNVVFLTNSADTQHLARDFKIPTKTIHQLRSLLGEDAPVAAPTPAVTPHHSKKHRATPSVNGDTEPKTLFSYEDESEDEELVFKPRGRGTARSAGAGRAGAYGSMRSKAVHPRSPRLSFSTPPNSANKPQIPIEEIDPDSFDRGSFGRGSMPLANTGGAQASQPHHQFNGTPRGPSRAGFTPTGPSRGSGHYRGSNRGFDRGSARGRGRLFVP
ncbi:hypothetical protein DV735_g4943, partial [Chaetothyriales sp. CBS 134920]